MLESPRVICAKTCWLQGRSRRLAFTVAALIRTSCIDEFAAALNDNIHHLQSYWCRAPPPSSAESCLHEEPRSLVLDIFEVLHAATDTTYTTTPSPPKPTKVCRVCLLFLPPPPPLSDVIMSLNPRRAVFASATSPPAGPLCGLPCWTRGARRPCEMRGS